MNEHLISVIIPVYNTVEYLPRCLDSILNNTYRNLEIICVNDGSKDNSLEVLNSYAAKDPRVKVIDQENAGVSAARNRGLDEATGEYIAFVDSDDWVHRQYFEVLLENALQFSADVSSCKELTVNELIADSNLEIGTLPIDLLTDVPLIENSYVIWGRLYRFKTIGAHRFDTQVQLSEDTLFNLCIIYDFPQIKLVNCCHELYYYYMRDNSAIHTLEPQNNEPLIRWYLTHLDHASTQSIYSYYLTKVTKHLLVWRYHAWVNQKESDISRIQPLIGQCVKELNKPSGRTVPNRRILLLFAQHAGLYRFFRIVHDPSLLRWEKAQRKRTKAVEKEHC